MAMRVPRTDYEWTRPASGTTEEHFDKGADLWEGINGCDDMNTKFENTERLQVMDPRGDHAGRPMPRDARFYNADNHGEWGPDKFDDKLDYGMDGPFGKDPYHGMGLPTRKRMSSNANPAMGGAGVVSTQAEEDPRDQGTNNKTP